MERSDVGKKLKNASGLLSVFLFSCLTSQGLTIGGRTFWFFSQQLSVPVATFQDQSRHQITFQGTNYFDTYSIQASAMAQLGPVELKVLGSQKFFSTGSERGNYLQQTLLGTEQTVGAELGRYFISSRFHFGRIAALYLRQMGAAKEFAGVTLSTGQLESEESPWSMYLQGSYISTVPKGRAVVLGSMESIYGFGTYKNSGRPWQMGFSLLWNLNIMPNATLGVYENMAFNFGPTFVYRSPVGILKLTAFWRLYLDYERYTYSDPLNPANLITSDAFPNDIFILPDFSLSYTIVF